MVSDQSETTLSLRDLLLTPSKVIASGSREIWDIIGQWQREGLVRVKPIKPEVAEVTLTETGRRRLTHV